MVTKKDVAQTLRVCAREVFNRADEIVGNPDQKTYLNINIDISDINNPTISWSTDVRVTPKILR